MTREELVEMEDALVRQLHDMQAEYRAAFDRDAAPLVARLKELREMRSPLYRIANHDEVVAQMQAPIDPRLAPTVPRKLG